MSNNSKGKTIPTYEKNDLQQCMNNFRYLILNNLDDPKRIKTNLISSGKMSHTEKANIRAFSWKVFLNTITLDEKSSLKTWIEETISRRKSIKNLIKKNTLNKFKGDPLGGGLSSEGNKEDDGWDGFFNQSETIRLIKFDVERTMPNEKLFQEPYIREMESTILKLFAKNHKDISYKQGMNEVLSVLIYVMYPYYIKSSVNKYTNEIIDKWVKDPMTNFKEIYEFFHDESELENDLYCLMENLMVKCGLAKFFDDPGKETNQVPYLIKRAKSIVIKKLGQQDREIYLHFINQNLDSACVFQRWLKCLFKREFPIKNVCLIWDAILANEAETNSGDLFFIDYVVIAMILNIKYDLLKRDNNEMFEILLHYPEVTPFSTLLTMAESIKNNFNTPSMPKPIEESLEEKNQFSTSSKQQPIVKKEKVEVEEGSQSTKNMLQINPLLFTNLLLNPQMTNNFQNNQNMNMMFYPYNPMMVQQPIQPVQPVNQPKPAPKMDFEILSKDDLSPMEKIKSSYYVSDSSSVNSLKELKDLGNKYKNFISVEDKNRLDFLIDSLSKKL